MYGNTVALILVLIYGALEKKYMDKSLYESILVLSNTHKWN